MSADLKALWAKLSADEQSACERIRACQFQWPQLQRDIVEALGGAGSENRVALVESLVRKGVLKRRAVTYWLAPAVDLAQLVPLKPTTAQAWAASAPRRAAPPPLPKAEVLEPDTLDIEPEPAPIPWLDPEHIIALVSEESQLPVAALKGDSTLPDAAKWRGIAMYLIRIHCHDGDKNLFTHARIGEMFGRTAAAVSTTYFEVRHLLEHGEEWYCSRVARLEQRLGLKAPEPKMEPVRTWGGEPQS